jgi:CheY-like chemotaxis protein
MDLQLPSIDGLTLTRALRRDDDLRDVVIILALGSLVFQVASDDVTRLVLPIVNNEVMP